MNYYTIYQVTKKEGFQHPAEEIPQPSAHCRSSILVSCWFLIWPQDASATDNWMDQVVNQGNKLKKLKARENPFEEFDRFFRSNPIPYDKCPDIISWFGMGFN